MVQIDDRQRFVRRGHSVRAGCEDAFAAIDDHASVAFIVVCADDTTMLRMPWAIR